MVCLHLVGILIGYCMWFVGTAGAASSNDPWISSAGIMPTLNFPAIKSRQIEKTASIVAKRLGESPEKPGASPQRKDGIWIIAEGVVPMGEETTLADAKLRSRNDARRQAVERAVGTFVTSKTIVHNYVLAEDLVQSVVRGIIVDEEMIEEGVREFPVGTASKALMYVTKLKARVKGISAAHTGNFTVNGTLNKGTFAENEEMEIRVSVSRDAYVHIFNVGQDNAVTVLFSNRLAQQNFIGGDAEFVFPDGHQRAEGIRLRVVPPAGATRAVERIKLIATTQKRDLIKAKFREAVFQVYEGHDTGFITDLLKELALLDDGEWTEMTMAYEIQKVKGEGR